MGTRYGTIWPNGKKDMNTYIFLSMSGVMSTSKRVTAWFFNKDWPYMHSIRYINKCLECFFDSVLGNQQKAFESWDLEPRLAQLASIHHIRLSSEFLMIFLSHVSLTYGSMHSEVAFYLLHNPQVSIRHIQANPKTQPSILS